MDWFEVAKWVAGLATALIAGGLVIKLAVKNKSSKDNSVRIVSQKYNNAGGDIIAGDSVKKTNK